MAKIIIMSGLPASGKSTAAKVLMEKSGNLVRLNKDLLRTMLHFDKFNFNNEGHTWNAEVALAIFYLTSGISIIVDDTNLNPKTITRWRELANKVDAKLEYMHMDTSIEECIKRDQEREKKVGRSVIEKMALQYKGWMKNQNVIICDLDGTLCDITHRLHFVKVKEGEKKDWDGFFTHIMSDSLRTDVWEQVQKELKDNNAKLIFVSARPNKYRPFTIDWLKDHIGEQEYILIMREDGDSRQDTEVKKDIFDKYLKNLKILKVFDDRPSVIRMWHEKGLNVVDCGSGVEF